MSKKLITILISTILGLLFLSLIGYYFIIQNGSPTGTDGGFSFRSFFPFGGETITPSETPNETENPSNEQEPMVNFTQKLRKLSSEPVAGAGILDIQAGSMVRYIEKATGHIYEVELFSPKQGRISNTTIPLVYDAVWGNSNNSLISRYLEDDDTTVSTYTLSLKNISTTTSATSSTTENTITGSAFPGGIADVSASGNSVFYLQINTNGSQGYVSNFDGSSRKLIWSSEMKELNSQFVNGRTVALNTKPYQGIDGYLYFIDTSTGQSRKIIGNIAGLSSLVSNAGTDVVYLQQTNNADLFLYNISSKTTAELTPATFPEKCVWSKNDSNIVYCAVPKSQIESASLTSWYQGLVSFADDIWRYDLTDGTSNIIGNLSEESGMQIDVMKPILSESEQYLIFINKIDNSLWSLDLTK